MKHRILAFLVAFLGMLSPCSHAQDANTLFPYPTAPEELPTLTAKCNYLVYNFWDRCNIKQSFSSLQRLNKAFGTWASFMPYATADTVHLAIDKYLESVVKEAPKSLPEVGKMAQNWFFCDTAQFFSEELYMPFCRVLAANKKVPEAVRAQYAARLKILESSSVGSIVPDFTFTRPDGSTEKFSNQLASRIILFFNDPDCFECTLAKARLSADYNTNKLIDAGLIKIVSIYPDEPTAEWKAEAAKYPENWTVGAAPDIDEFFDLSETPAIYWLDGRHKVISKNVNIDGLLLYVQQVHSQYSNK